MLFDTFCFYSPFLSLLVFVNQSTDEFLHQFGMFPSCIQLSDSQMFDVWLISFSTALTTKLNEFDIYGDVKRQKLIVNIYSDLLEVRENLKNEIE